jgi:putative membrane protein
MPYFLVTWLLAALALILTAYLVPGVRIDGLTSAIIGAAVLGFVNAIVRPILILLTLPLTILTLGFFLLIINAITLSIVAFFTPGFTITNILSALIGSIVLTIVTAILGSLAGDEQEA